MVTGAICPTLFLNTKITSLLFYFNTRREGASRRDRINLIRRLVALQLQMLMFDGNFCTVPTFVMKEKCHFQMHCLTLLYLQCLGAHSHIRGLGLDDALEARQVMLFTTLAFIIIVKVNYIPLQLYFVDCMCAWTFNDVEVFSLKIWEIVLTL